MEKKEYSVEGQEIPAELKCVIRPSEKVLSEA